MKISDNKYIALSYDLYVGEGEEKELMEQATSERPMEFIYGSKMMLDAFEKELFGLEEGDSFEFQLTPEQSYGDYNDDYVKELSIDLFKINDEFDSNIVREGAFVPMLDSNGNRLMGLVLAVNKETVIMDFNHPLAGENLYFSGNVLEVHEATAEEIATLCSGGCGCCSEGCDDCGSQQSSSCCGGSCSN
ncbi:MAG: FKBP-type peptidyl-prolyl cis-trans isomerase [Fermentimonas sp.]|jgi:FKBP-type peptidyl-prolyl cis-trans isomerase SlyD